MKTGNAAQAARAEQAGKHLEAKAAKAQTGAATTQVKAAKAETIAASAQKAAANSQAKAVKAQARAAKLAPPPGAGLKPEAVAPPLRNPAAAASGFAKLRANPGALRQALQKSAASKSAGASSPVGAASEVGAVGSSTKVAAAGERSAVRGEKSVDTAHPTPGLAKLQAHEQAAFAKQVGKEPTHDERLALQSKTGLSPDKQQDPQAVAQHLEQNAGMKLLGSDGKPNQQLVNQATDKLAVEHAAANQAAKTGASQAQAEGASAAKTAAGDDDVPQVAGATGAQAPGVGAPAPSQGMDLGTKMMLFSTLAPMVTGLPEMIKGFKDLVHPTPTPPTQNQVIISR